MSTPIDILGSELVDLLTECLAAPARAEDRADALVAVLACAQDAVSWRLEPVGDPIEERGVEAVLASAVQHRDAMRRRNGHLVAVADCGCSGRI